MHITIYLEQRWAAEKLKEVSVDLYFSIISDYVYVWEIQRVILTSITCAITLLICASVWEL